MNKKQLTNTSFFYFSDLVEIFDKMKTDCPVTNDLESLQLGIGFYMKHTCKSTNIPVYCSPWFYIHLLITYSQSPD